ncbi:MAG TPA: efflux RND transporter periplasmic adaptor subunit [Polyangiaceae bacterium]|nr:efflux RND transporter periplasmic adaptor subunit [Polyangiaceae bacterium]
MKTPNAAAIAVALLFASACDEKKGPPAPAPPAVYVTAVARRDLGLYVEAVGALDGYDNADIRARVRGYLRAQAYKDGSRVKPGDLLFTIEATEYAASVESAKANLERARVARDRNRIQLDRDKGLQKSGMISQQDVDNATASLADSEAQILAAQAALDTASLNLSYTQIHAPIDGVAGIALVRVGNLVGQDGPTLLTTVSQTDPIRVNFSLSEVDYVRYPDRFKNLEQRNLAWANKQIAALEAGGPAESGDPGVELVLADGSSYRHRGIIVTANRQIDASTGTIQVQALAANPDGLLRPGQYAHVRMRRTDAGHDVLVVPEKALISVQGSYSVAVVGPDDTVQLREVELGPASHGSQIINRGLAEGDRVVVEGTQKVSDGARVVAKAAPEPLPPASESSVARSASAASRN